MSDAISTVFGFGPYRDRREQRIKNAIEELQDALNADGRDYEIHVGSQEHKFVSADANDTTYTYTITARRIEPIT